MSWRWLHHRVGSCRGHRAPRRIMRTERADGCGQHGGWTKSLSRPGRPHLYLWAHRRVGRRAHWALAFGPVKRPSAVFFYFNFWVLFKYSQNSNKLQKSIEISTDLSKMQSKFCWTPCDPIYSVNLLKLYLHQNMLCKYSKKQKLM
jgi:hypothetical protein